MFNFFVFHRFFFIEYIKPAVAPSTGRGASSCEIVPLGDSSCTEKAPRRVADFTSAIT